MQRPRHGQGPRSDAEGAGHVCFRGHMREHMGGHGGGGAFLEALVAVKPGERLELTVGAGGAAGEYAREDAEQGIICGLAAGGIPGGGDGYSGSPVYGCGGGTEE